MVALTEDHSLVEEGSGRRILVRLAEVVAEPESQDCLLMVHTPANDRTVALVCSIFFDIVDHSPGCYFLFLRNPTALDKWPQATVIDRHLVHTTGSKTCAVDSEVGESVNMVTVVFDNPSDRLSCAQTDWSTTKQHDR